MSSPGVHGTFQTGRIKCQALTLGPHATVTTMGSRCEALGVLCAENRWTGDLVVAGARGRPRPAAHQQWGLQVNPGLFLQGPHRWVPADES